jgi:hypothetical protein
VWSLIKRRSKEGVQKDGTKDIWTQRTRNNRRLREKKNLHNEELHNLYSSSLREERGDMKQARYRWKVHTELL